LETATDGKHASVTHTEVIAQTTYTAEEEDLLRDCSEDTRRYLNLTHWRVWFALYKKNRRQQDFAKTRMVQIKTRAERAAARAKQREAFLKAEDEKRKAKTASKNPKRADESSTPTPQPDVFKAVEPPPDLENRKRAIDGTQRNKGSARPEDGSSHAQAGEQPAHTLDHRLTKTTGPKNHGLENYALQRWLAMAQRPSP